MQIEIERLIIVVTEYLCSQHTCRAVIIHMHTGYRFYDLNMPVVVARNSIDDSPFSKI